MPPQVFHDALIQIYRSALSENCSLHPVLRPSQWLIFLLFLDRNTITKLYYEERKQSTQKDYNAKEAFKLLISISKARGLTLENFKECVPLEAEFDCKSWTETDPNQDEVKEDERQMRHFQATRKIIIPLLKELNLDRKQSRKTSNHLAFPRGIDFCTYTEEPWVGFLYLVDNVSTDEEYDDVCDEWIVTVEKAECVRERLEDMRESPDPALFNEKTGVDYETLFYVTILWRGMIQNAKGRERGGWENTSDFSPKLYQSFYKKLVRRIYPSPGQGPTNTEGSIRDSLIFLKDLKKVWPWENTLSGEGFETWSNDFAKVAYRARASFTYIRDMVCGDDQTAIQRLGLQWGSGLDKEPKWLRPFERDQSGL